MKQDSTRNAAYTVDCEDYVHMIKFNPFNSGDACSLIAYGGNNYVVAGTCRFQFSFLFIAFISCFMKLTACLLTKTKVTFLRLSFPILPGSVLLLYYINDFGIFGLKEKKMYI